MSPIIDAHSHYMPPEIAAHTAFFKVGWSDIKRHLASMDQRGIEKALLLYPTSDAHLHLGGWTKMCRLYNEKIVQVVQEYPDRFMGAGILPPDHPEALREELKRIEDYDFRLLSLASSYDGKYLDDPYFEPVFAWSSARHIPIHVHPQILNPIGCERLKDPLLSPVLEYVFDVSVTIGRILMNGTLQKFPEQIFIFAHYGGVLPIVKERFDNTYQMLRKRQLVKDLVKNPSEYFQHLYFDTSGSRSKASLECALEVVDASHILFGSDYPANQNLEDSIAVVTEALGATSRAKDILFFNIARILKANEIEAST